MFNNFINSFFARIIPLLRILKKNISWDELTNYLSNVNLSTFNKIYPPYKICNASIGDYTYIERNSMISYTNIGKYCSIGPNFFSGWGIHPTNGISTSPMFYSKNEQHGMTISKENKIRERKIITIGNDVFIGANVSILDGVTIGDGAIIGAGAVVSKDIPPYAIAVGIPIKIIRYRFSESQIESLLKIQWWNFQKEKLQDVEQMFFDIDGFIKKYDV